MSISRLYTIIQTIGMKKRGIKCPIFFWTIATFDKEILKTLDSQFFPPFRWFSFVKFFFHLILYPSALPPCKNIFSQGVSRTFFFKLIPLARIQYHIFTKMSSFLQKCLYFLQKYPDIRTFLLIICIIFLKYALFIFWFIQIWYSTA